MSRPNTGLRTAGLCTCIVCALGAAAAAQPTAPSEARGDAAADPQVAPPDGEQADEVIVVEGEAPAESASSVHFDRDDLEERPHNRPSDLLRQTPGLVVSQHAGGGKSDQYFLRGFDADHGTDVAIFVDGIPVNLTSHGHGQGYADTHWLIPETVDTLDVHKGPYAARFGDFYTAGAIDIRTVEPEPGVEVWLSGGTELTGPVAMRRPTSRLVGMASPALDAGSAMIAAEIGYTDGPFVDPQDYGHAHLLAKVSCLYRNVTGQPPCYAHGQEPGPHVEIEAFASPVHHRAEGRVSPGAPGRQGPGLGGLHEARPSAQRVLPVAAAGSGQPRCRADGLGAQRPEQAREGARRAGRAARGPAREEGRRHRRGLGRVRRAKKRTWGALTGRWVPHDTRDTVVDFVRDWSAKTEIPAERFIAWIGIARGKFFDWRKRYGKANEHNALVPRDHWLTDEEKQRILRFFEKFPLEGYRRLTFMMLDADVAAASPSTVYRVLAGAGLLDRWNRTPSKKGTGFVQPLRPHEHWHIDIAYLNLAGTFYYLCSILDGASRAVVHWEIRESMTEADVECILLRAREQHPHESPRVISDNGPQFIAKDFKEFIRLTGMTHVRTSLYYPQSNGKIERWHKTIKADAIRPGQPATLAEARALVGRWVEHYNTVRLHSAIGYITPADFLAGRSAAIWAERDRKLEVAREARATRRAELRQEAA